MQAHELKDFNKGLDKIKAFAIDEQWLTSLCYDVLIDEELLTFTIETINFCLTDHAIDEIESLFSTIRLNCQNTLKEINKYVSPYNKWLIARKAYFYYGLLEILIEGSVFSNVIIENIKKQYKKQYLEIVSVVDKLNPSYLTNFNFENKEYNLKNIDIDTEEIKKYILLKKWQDNQHVYHDNIIYPIFDKCREEFKEWAHKYYPSLNYHPTITLILLKLLQQPLINMDDISKCIIAGLEEELIKLVGGKMYGLSLLNSMGIAVPQALVLPINKSIEDIDFNQYLDSNMKYAVRSSADVEDGKNTSFAGLFESYLDVNLLDIKDYIYKVKESVNNNRLQAYLKKFNIKRPHMAVIIQEYQEPVISGVWIGRSIDEGILEWVDGIGQKLVLGQVKPNIEICNKGKNSVKRLKNNGKIIKELLQLQKEIGAPCDFEWCIIDGKLWLLQYRPVTKNIQTIIFNDNTSSIIGISASGGEAEGKLKFIEDINNIDNWEDNCILLTYYTDPDWVPIMINAKGIITAEGGFLCHAAIIARELNIPCITGIGEENLEKLKNLDEIRLDGGRGLIKIPKKKQLYKKY